MIYYEILRNVLPVGIAVVLSWVLIWAVLVPEVFPTLTWQGYKEKEWLVALFFIGGGLRAVFKFSKLFFG